MDDLPYKPGMSPAERELAALREELAKEKARNAKLQAARKRSTAKKTTTVKRAQTAQPARRPVKQLPPLKLPGEDQPRDRLGRFARKTGSVLKGALFGTARVVGGTIAAAQSGHKTVKRVLRKKRANGSKVGLVKSKRVRRRRKR